MDLGKSLKQKIIKAQTNEITEYYIYRQLAVFSKNAENRQVLIRIAEQEKRHYQFWQGITRIEVKPKQFKILFYSVLVRILGINFTARLMEVGEEQAQEIYNNLKQVDPQVASYLIVEEQKHEKDILGLIDSKYLQYAGSFVLGLSDAIVELSGALAGLTLALQRTSLIGFIGLITGIAAAMSMAGSEYLSTKEEGGKNALRASIFTGAAYLIAVVILIFPYFIMVNPFIALSMTISLALLIILFFTFYISIAKGVSFQDRFWSMAGISLGVAVINFFIGLGIRYFFAIEV